VFVPSWDSSRHILVTLKLRHHELAKPRRCPKSRGGLQMFDVGGAGVLERPTVAVLGHVPVLRHGMKELEGHDLCPKDVVD
jgi:hypothetical protein